MGNCMYFIYLSKFLILSWMNVGSEVFALLDFDDMSYVL